MNLKKIFLFTFILLSYSKYILADAPKYINLLSKNDKHYTNFTKQIQANNRQWANIKLNFKPELIQNIIPLSISFYIVKKNDTIFSIAEKMYLTSDTLISFNSMSSNVSVSEGEKILIPNMNGVVIFPAVKTNTETIARIYNIPETLLLHVNNIKSGIVPAKEEIFIPFARMSDEEKAYFLSTPFIYPLLGGHYTSDYGLRFHPIRKRWIFHGGVDIGTPVGSKVLASANGTVLYAGRGSGYGILVVLKHKFGYTTWYGHLSKILVKKGQKISQRDIIALSGNTGITTGPHLHFEVRRFNLRTNPMEVLSFTHIATVID